MNHHAWCALLIAGVALGLGCSADEGGERSVGDAASSSGESAAAPSVAAPAAAPANDQPELPSTTAPPVSAPPPQFSSAAAPDSPTFAPAAAAPPDAVIAADDRPPRIPVSPLPMQAPAPVEDQPSSPSNPLRNAFSTRALRSEARSFAAPAAPESTPLVSPEDVTSPGSPSGGAAPPPDFQSAQPDYSAYLPGSPAPAEPEAASMPNEVSTADSNDAFAAPARAQGFERQSAAAMPAGDAASASTPIEVHYDVVKVFYGTDRQGEELSADTWQAAAQRYAGVSGALLVTLLFAAGALILPARRALLGTLTLCGSVATVGFGYFALAETFIVIRQSAKEGVRYTTARNPSGQVELGVCEVTIPRTHQTGELEGPSILKLEVRENSRDHIVLRKTERLADDAFYEQLRRQVAASPQREVFVFVHGFNTSFEDAARRTAQLSYDLPFLGAPICFSWPANELYMLTYAADETNVAWASPHLKRFLLDIVQHSEAKSINLIAHSMGNRALTTALRELELEFKAESRFFDQVVLAAPDIDAADFRDNIAPAIVRTANRVTLYASSGDQALAASQLVHRYPRAGDTQPELVVVEGIDTIDASLVGSSPWGHTYYGSSDPILRDISLLLQGSQPAAERRWLTSAAQAGRPYWVFQPTTAAASAAPAALR